MTLPRLMAEDIADETVSDEDCDTLLRATLSQPLSLSQPQQIWLALRARLLRAPQRPSSPAVRLGHRDARAAVRGRH